MKLTSALVERTLTQFEAQALPENHPAIDQLNSLFGEHTYFLDINGLNIVEPTGETDAGAPTAQVIKLAEWKDANQTSLVPHDPQPMDLVIVLDNADPNDAA